MASSLPRGEIASHSSDLDASVVASFSVRFLIDSLLISPYFQNALSRREFDVELLGRLSYRHAALDRDPLDELVASLVLYWTVRHLFSLFNVFLTFTKIPALRLIIIIPLTTGRYSLGFRV